MYVTEGSDFYLIICCSRINLINILHFLTSVSFSLLILLQVGVIQLPTRVLVVESALTTFRFQTFFGSPKKVVYQGFSVIRFYWTIV